MHTMYDRSVCTFWIPNYNCLKCILVPLLQRWEFSKRLVWHTQCTGGNFMPWKLSDTQCTSVNPWFGLNYPRVFRLKIYVNIICYFGTFLIKAAPSGLRVNKAISNLMIFALVIIANLGQWLSYWHSKD